MNDFRFANPKYLLLLLLLGAVFLLLRRIRKGGREKLSRFVAPANLARLLKSTGTLTDGTRRMALWAGLTLMVLALARPQANPEVEEVEGMSLDVYVLLDISRSMDAEDAAPSRLRKAKKSVTHLLDLLSGDRVGVIGFAGSSALLVPLTSDYEIVRSVLQNVDTSIIPSQGTDLGGALELAQGAMQRGAQVTGNNGPARTNIFVVMSDGEDHATGDLSVADSIRKEGGLIFTIAFGTEKGVPIPVRNERGELAGYKRDPKGETVLSAVQPKSLTEIAQRGGGQFYYSTLEEQEIEDIIARVKTAVRTGSVVTKAVVYEEFFVPVLLLALACLLYSFFSFQAIFSRKNFPWARSAAILLLLSGTAQASPVSLFWDKEKRVAEQSRQLKEEGKPEAAAEKLKALQAENPDSPGVNYNLGTYLLEAQKLKEGREQLSRVARDRNYFQAEALYNLAGSYMLEKKRPQAIAGYAEVIRQLEHKQNLIGKERDILQKARESLAMLSQQEQQNPQNQQSNSEQNQQGGGQDQQNKDQQQQSKGGEGDKDKKDENKDKQKGDSGDQGKEEEKKKDEGKDEKDKKEQDKKEQDGKEGDQKQDQNQPQPQDGQQNPQQSPQNGPMRRGGQPFKERDNISEADAKRILESLKEQEGSLQKKFLKKNGKDSRVSDDEHGQDW